MLITCEETRADIDQAALWGLGAHVFLITLCNVQLGHEGFARPALTQATQPGGIKQVNKSSYCSSFFPPHGHTGWGRWRLQPRPRHPTQEAPTGFTELPDVTTEGPVRASWLLEDTSHYGPIACTPGWKAIHAVLKPQKLCG